MSDFQNNESLNNKIFYEGNRILPLDYKYTVPPVDLLKKNQTDTTDEKSAMEIETVRNRSQAIEKTLLNFKYPAKVTGTVTSPTVTRYELSVDSKVNISKLKSILPTLKFVLNVESVRLITTVNGTATLGLEIPNKNLGMANIGDVIDSAEFTDASPSDLPIALGVNTENKPVVVSLKKTSHLLVTGATGMGVIPFLNTLLISLTYKCGADDLRLVLVDPVEVEFIKYKGIPQLYGGKIYSEYSEIDNVLTRILNEIDDRLMIFQSFQVRNAEEYNDTIDKSVNRKMPKIVLVINDIYHFTCQSTKIKNEFLNKLTRIMQKGRAAGVHVVLAVQENYLNTLPRSFMMNIPGVISFKTFYERSSRAVLNSNEATLLCKNGDMLYKNPADIELDRICLAYVSNDEVDAVTENVKANNVSYSESKSKWTDEINGAPLLNIIALKYVIEKQLASISTLQRNFHLGYSTAGRIIDWMEKNGYISAMDETHTRRILITQEDFNKLYGMLDVDMEDLV